MLAGAAANGHGDCQRPLHAAARRLAAPSSQPAASRCAIMRRDAAPRPALGARRRAGGLDAPPPARARAGLAARPAARLHALGGRARAASRAVGAALRWRLFALAGRRLRAAAGGARWRRGSIPDRAPDDAPGVRLRVLAANVAGRRATRRRACARSCAARAGRPQRHRAAARGGARLRRRAGIDELFPHRALEPRPGFSGTGLYSRLPLRVAPRPAGTQFAARAASLRAARAPRRSRSSPSTCPRPPRPSGAANGAATCARCRRPARAGCGSWPATSTPRSTTPSCGALLDRGYRDAAEQAGVGLRTTWPTDRPPRARRWSPSTTCSPTAASSVTSARTRARSPAPTTAACSPTCPARCRPGRWLGCAPCCSSPDGSPRRSCSRAAGGRAALPVHGGQRRRPRAVQRLRHRDPRARRARRPQHAGPDLGRAAARRAGDGAAADPGRDAQRRPAALLLGARGGPLLLRRRRADRLHARRPRYHARRAVRGRRHLHARRLGVRLHLHGRARRSSPAASRRRSTRRPSAAGWSCCSSASRRSPAPG